jgi:hypothetical protein
MGRGVRETGLKEGRGQGWVGGEKGWIAMYLCCAFDVLGVAADEGGLLLLVGHGYDLAGVFGRCLVLGLVSDLAVGLIVGSIRVGRLIRLYEE